jgi:hypothetical protein
MCAYKKSDARSGAQECKCVPANELSGVQPVAGTADLSVDLVNRFLQLVLFLLKLILELMNIFVCAHKTPSPTTVRLLAEFQPPMISPFGSGKRTAPTVAHFNDVLPRFKLRHFQGDKLILCALTVPPPALA